MLIVKERFEDTVKPVISDFVSCAMPTEDITYIEYDIIGNVNASLTTVSAAAYASIDLPDGIVDLELEIVEPPLRVDDRPADPPCVDSLHATRGIQDADENHVKTLSWDDKGSVWFLFENPEEDPTA